MRRIDEIERLQDCINNLVSLLALSALWNGRKPRQVVDTLGAVLGRMLRAEFVYARINTPTSGARIEICRVARRRKLTRPPVEVGHALEPWLHHDTPGVVRMVPNPLGKGEVSITHCWLGLEQDVGAVVAPNEMTSDRD